MKLKCGNRCRVCRRDAVVLGESREVLGHEPVSVVVKPVMTVLIAALCVEDSNVDRIDVSFVGVVRREHVHAQLEGTRTVRRYMSTQ